MTQWLLSLSSPTGIHSLVSVTRNNCPRNETRFGHSVSTLCLRWRHSRTQRLVRKFMPAEVTRLVQRHHQLCLPLSDDLDGVARTTFLGSILSRCAVGKNP